MCGIFAVIKKNQNSIDISKIKNSLKKIKYRGPDNTSINKISENIVFGHNRLKIIDLSENSNQPMYANGCYLIFNGCIYNYQEIKKKLSNKYSFRTSGDTEILLYSLIEWGEKALNIIDGMFSFVFFDGKKIISAIDDFGEKPLFYFENTDEIIFSSEIVAIKEYLSNKIQKNISDLILKEFVYLGYLTGEKTIYKKIYKCLPTKIYYFEKNNFFSKDKIYNSVSLNDKLDDIHNELINSIKLRLISNQPVSLLLSSGIDSSLLLVILKKELKIDLDTYSFYESHDIENIKFVKKLTNHLNIENKIIPKLNFNYDASGFYHAFNDLNDCETYFPFYRMINYISNNSNTKVILSGTGADEIFYGYNKYKFAYDRVNYYRFFDYFDKITNLKYFSNLNFYIGNNNHRFLKLKNNKVFLYDKDINDIIKLNDKNNLYEEMRNFDLNNTLPFSIIPALERASMRNSIENRSPYLSKKLLKIINSFKNKNLYLGEQKKFQKEIIKRYLPSSFVMNKKEGFFSTKKVSISKNNILNLMNKLKYNYKDLNPRDKQRLAIYNYFKNN